MAKIILSETSLRGVQGATKRKHTVGKVYRKLIEEADRQIDEDRFRYAESYKKAATYLAR